MNTPLTCSHCALPLGRLGQRREVHGEPLWFCCYGCCLAWQVHHGAREEPEAAALLIRLGVGAFLAMNIMLFSLLLYADAFTGAEAWLGALVPWLLWALATPLLVMLGGPFLGGAWRAALQGRLTADTLVGIGAGAAYAYSAWQVVEGSGQVYFDTAAMVLLLFTLGRYLEAEGRVRAARSLAPMLAAERAEVRVVDDGADTIRPVGSVRPGDIVRVLPGERIAADGHVVEGRSECDESVLTGQPQLRPKGPGAFVHAGSVNGGGQLLVCASVAGGATRWIRIGRLVRDALAEKSLLAVTVDRVAGLFVPWVLLLALATVGFWSTRGGFGQALLAGLAVLVVACPCSMGLAAPMATALGIGQAARRGILIRGGGVLEKLARLKGIAFDKTGTLTRGRLQPVSITADGTSVQELMRRARLLSVGSDHPVARAIIAMSPNEGSSAVTARDIRAHPGAGLCGEIDGVPCALGSAAFMAALGWTFPAGLAAPGAGTRVHIGWAGCVHGCLLLADAPVPGADQVMAALRARGVATLLLSGDTASAVAPAAQMLGIAAWRAELAPEAKARILRRWAARRGPVAMVGDGLNDGPVLASATVGIAVGGATDLAKESADVILPEAGVTYLPWLLDLAGAVRRSVRANLVWAFGYNAVALALAASGLLQPVLAAALMAGSSLIVVARSLRAARGAVQGDAGGEAPAMREQLAGDVGAAPCGSGASPRSATAENRAGGGAPTVAATLPDPQR